jgi:hypothetical protein
MMPGKKGYAGLAVELFVAICLSVYFFFLMLPMADAPRRTDGNEMNIYLFTYMSEHPYSTTNMIADFDNWRGRLAGPMLSGWVYDHFPMPAGQDIIHTGVLYNDYVTTLTANIFGIYHATWLLLLFLILIVHRKDALLIMLGVFSGIMYNLALPSGEWFYPWDIPSMMFFTWAWLLYDRRQILSMALVIWIGSLFKETALCCAILILMNAGWPVKKRILVFVGLAAVCVATRKLMMWSFGVHTLFFALNNVGSLGTMISATFSQVIANVEKLTSFNLNHVLFANAGALLIMLLLPWRGRRMIEFKLLALVFICGQFMFGLIDEFRIWYELLPLGWMIISEFMSVQPCNIIAPAVQP